MILTGIYDKKAFSFEAIFVSKNAGVAVRNFSEACQDAKTNLNKFPQDYELHSLCDVNQETGEISNVKNVIIAKATDFVEKEEKCQEEQK